MAIIRNAANTLMKGRVGQTTFYISKGQQVARQSRNDSNYGETARRTLLQQNRRVMWANLVQFYKISARWMPKAFESKRSGQTDYNKFMAVNVRSAIVPLTKSEAEAGACVVDAFIVSQGSLPSIEVSQIGSAWKSNLYVGNLSINNTTTVGDLTEALLDNNANLRADMQLSFVMYQQSVDSMGTPRVNCRCYELTLNSNSTDLVRDHIPELGSSVVDGAIGTSPNMPTGAFAWILSELQNGSLKVSTQLLTTNNAVLLAAYENATQLEAAATSYGIDTEVLLNPDNTVSQSLEPYRPAILSMVFGGQSYLAGSYFGYINQAYQKSVFLNLAGMGDLQVTAAATRKTDRSGQSDVPITTTVVSGTANPVELNWPGLAEDDTMILKSISLTLSDGTVLTIPFANSQPSGGGDMG